MIDFPTPWKREGAHIYSADGEFICAAEGVNDAELICAKVNAACGNEWERECNRGMENRIAEKREA